MSLSNEALRRALYGAAATMALVALGSGQAFAAEGDASGAPDADALRAQVRQLSALVQSLSQHDQEQIQALSDQVKTLQSRLDQATTATPRAAQGVEGGPVLQAQSGAAADSQSALPRVVQNSSKHFALQSPDGQYSIGFTGGFQFDTGDYVNFHPASKLSGPQALSAGENARRARFGVAGTAFGDWGYAFVYDAGNSQDTTPKGIQTAQLVYGGLKGAAFEIGYSNTFFTLDQSTSGYDTLFLERASPSDIATSLNTGDSRANAGARFFGDRYWVGGYLTGPASGDSHTLIAERFGAFERVAVQALKGPDYSLHLGVGVDELLQAPNTGNGTANAISLSTQPELRIDPTTFLNTGTVGTLANPVTGAYVLNVESAATFRNLFWQGEYYHYQIDRQALPRADFDGGYGQVSWTITGENHKYNPQAGAYYRIVPTKSFSLASGQWGAWELAARVSYVDLNSNFVQTKALTTQPAAIDGGLQRSYTFGINWYPNEIVRLLLDYNHVDYEKDNGVVTKGLALGAPVGAQFDAVSLRVQVVY